MATRKQLAASAKARAVRKAKLSKRNRKSTRRNIRKSKKRTNFSFSTIGKKIENFGKGVKNVSDVAGNIFSPLAAVANGLEYGGRIKRAIGSFFEDDRALDTGKMKVILANLKKKLLNRDPLNINNPIMERINDVNKSLLYIDMLKDSGEDDEAKREIRYTLRMVAEIMETYQRLMNK